MNSNLLKVQLLNRIKMISNLKIQGVEVRLCYNQIALKWKIKVKLENWIQHLKTKIKRIKRVNKVNKMILKTLHYRTY